MSHLRVLHLANPPRDPFKVTVENVEEAKDIIRTLWRYDLYLGDLITSNVTELEIFINGEWIEWRDDNDDSICEIIEREDSDEYCPECEEIREDGCIHSTACCGAPVIECTDLCSACKEHTGYADV